MVAAAGRGEGWFGGARVCGDIKKMGRAGGRGVVRCGPGSHGDGERHGGFTPLS
jgi:hypothetical protein